MFRLSRAARGWVVALSVVLAGMTASAADAPKRCTAPLQECLDHMSAVLKSSGWVGIEYEYCTESPGGYRVTKVIPESPAEKAGLQPGDLLYELNGVRLNKANDAALAAARKEWKPGQSVTYTVKRQGVERTITLTLAPMPADVMARWIGEHMLLHAANGSAPAK